MDGWMDVTNGTAHKTATVWSCKQPDQVTDHQGRSQRGDMGECPPPSWIGIKFAQLQRDDCFSTGVTPDVDNTSKTKRKCAISTLIFRKFSGGTPTLPRPTPSAVRRFVPPRLTRDLRASVVVSPLIKMLATRLPTAATRNEWTLDFNEEETVSATSR